MGTTFNAVQDSGERQHFDTGSVRDTAKGKGRPSLASNYALTRFFQHLENGAEKYEDRNWEKGQPLSRYFDSAIRHLYKYMEGWRDEDHLSAAWWNIHCLIHTEEMIRRGVLSPKLNDLPEPGSYFGPHEAVDSESGGAPEEEPAQSPPPPSLWQRIWWFLWGCA